MPIAGAKGDSAIDVRPRMNCAPRAKDRNSSVVFARSHIHRQQGNAVAPKLPDIDRMIPAKFDAIQLRSIFREVRSHSIFNCIGEISERCVAHDIGIVPGIEPGIQQPATRRLLGDVELDPRGIVGKEI